MTRGVGSGCQPDAVPKAGGGTALSGDPPVPALKLFPSPYQALLIGEMQAAEAGVAKAGRKATISEPLSDSPGVGLLPATKLPESRAWRRLCQPALSGTQPFSAAQPPHCHVYIFNPAG